MENAKNNNKKFASILLVIIALIGSICAFYMTNLLLSDLGNMFYGVHDAYIVSSFPGFFIALYFILGAFFVYRYFYRPEFKRRTILTYLFIASCFALIGIITSIITGISIYKNFFAPYPFWGYTIICLIIHILVLLCSIFLNILIRKKLPKDESKKRMSILYILINIISAILVFFAFNRLGAFLISPIYIYWRNLYLTFPFYLSLLLPMAELVHLILFKFDYFDAKPKAGFIYSIVMIILDVVLLSIVIILGYNFSEFVSAISPALGLERLATAPLVIVLTIIIMICFSGYNLFYSIRYLKKHNQDQKE